MAISGLNTSLARGYIGFKVEYQLVVVSLYQSPVLQVA
jgi:hypothetical protein